MATVYFRCISLISTSLLLLSMNSQAANIDFESIPAGAPFDGMVIGTQFEAEYGVSFSLSNGELPVLAQVGGYETAFEGFNDLPDTPVSTPDQHVGQFFLTDDTSLGLSTDLIVDYSTAVSAASGVLLDIDRNEIWTITAFDSQGAQVDQQVIQDGDIGTGDGLATTWSFNHGSTTDIAQLVFSGFRPIGQNRFGLAFDNFSPSEAVSEVPIPAALWLFCSALSGLLIRRRNQGAALLHSSNLL